MCHRTARRRPAVHSLLALTGATALAACSGADAGDADPPLPTWALEEELRMGSVDDPDYAFTRIGGLEIGPDGSLYTLHPQDAQIRRWTGDGEPAGTVGRQGEGPGEFTAPSTMGWRGDTLWVFDRRTSRVTYFDPDGTYRRDVTLELDLGTREQSAAGIYPARPRSLLGDGTVYAMTPGFSQDIVEGTLTEIAHVRTDLEGTHLDTIAVLPTSSRDVLGILRDGGGTFSPQPFGDGVLSTLSHDGGSLLVLDRTATTDPEGRAQWRLTRVDLEGDTVFSRTYSYVPAPIPGEKVDSAVEATAGRLHEWLGERTGTSLSQWIADVREAVHVPHHYPPVEALHAGRDGTIWVRLTTPGADAGTWQVLDASGEPVGRVETPAGLRLLAAERRAVWGVEQDELDVEYLVRYLTVMP